MKRPLTSLRRLALAFGLLTLSVSQAYAQKAYWWCYNGTCCRWQDDQMEQETCASCPGANNGDNGGTRPGECY